ncbi:MAG: hypothetical protein R3F49_21480 [Planctomycetota bacterium]
MSSHRSSIKSILRSLEAAFAAFERGQRGQLFDSRDALVQLSQEAAAGGWGPAVPLCDVTAKLLGRVLREGALDERGAVAVVRELLALIEGQIDAEPVAAPGQLVSDGAGGVFKVVNGSRLGDVLIKMGKLHPAQVQQALVLQRVSKDKRFGEVLIAMNAIDQRTLNEALEAQHVEARGKTGPSGAPGAPGSGLRLAPLPDLPPGPPAPLPLRPSPPSPAPQAPRAPFDARPGDWRSGDSRAGRPESSPNDAV